MESAIERYLKMVDERCWSLRSNADEVAVQPQNRRSAVSLLFEWQNESEDGCDPIMCEWHQAVSEIAITNCETILFPLLKSVRDAYFALLYAFCDQTAPPNDYLMAVKSRHNELLTAMTAVEEAIEIPLTRLRKTVYSPPADANGWPKLSPKELAIIFKKDDPSSALKLLKDRAIVHERITSKCYRIDPSGLPDDWGKRLANATGRD